MIQYGELIRATGERIPATRREVHPGKIEIWYYGGLMGETSIRPETGDRFEVYSATNYEERCRQHRKAEKRVKDAAGEMLAHLEALDGYDPSDEGMDEFFMAWMRERRELINKIKGGQ